MPLKTLVFLFLGTAVQAAIQHPLDGLKVIEVPISRQGLTRIAVKEDRILNVFGVAGEYVMEADEDQGQVFIRPVGPGAFKPISLTLTTESGHTQDLHLIPKDQAPEALILKAEEDVKEKPSRVQPIPLLAHMRNKGIDPEVSLEEKVSSSPLTRGDIARDDITRNNITRDVTRDDIETLLQACREGRIALGYKSMPLDLKTLKGPYLLVREVKGEKLRGLTYEVNNTTKVPMKLAEAEFAKSRDIIAVLITQKTLKPGERTHVHVVARSS